MKAEGNSGREIELCVCVLLGTALELEYKVHRGKASYYPAFSLQKHQHWAGPAGRRLDSSPWLLEIARAAAWAAPRAVTQRAAAGTATAPAADSAALPPPPAPPAVVKPSPSAVEPPSVVEPPPSAAKLTAAPDAGHQRPSPPPKPLVPVIMPLRPPEELPNLVPPPQSAVADDARRTTDDGRRTDAGRGLSRFSSDENGTAPFKAEGGASRVARSRRRAKRSRVVPAGPHVDRCAGAGPGAYLGAARRGGSGRGRRAEIDPGRPPGPAGPLRRCVARFRRGRAAAEPAPRE